MTDTTAPDSVLWAATLIRVRQELAELAGAERAWLAAQLARIGLLQTRLDELFRGIDGPTVCRDCLGGCCSRAKHHVTLTNVLGYLLDGDEPPLPDFTLDCPLLSEQGCRLPVERRPFNCTIFLCETLDAALSSEQRGQFATIERKLRASYQAVAARCPGASLRGLLLASARAGERPLLTDPRRR